MPESYIEPLTDRQQCYTCHKTVTGKKKLSKCAGCHAITYCGVECQREDFQRHKWNCLPVMVTEIPGKGRGLVAARDIKMGELIFVDKPVIKISSDEEPRVICESLRKQIDKLPSEAKRQFNLLEILPEFQDDDDDSEQDENMLNFAKFVSNSSGFRDGNDPSGFCYLNIVLINHSCAPNVSKGHLLPDEEHKQEVRAIKDIKRGDEITSCYLVDIDLYLWSCGFDKQRRMKRIQERFGFACKCSVCSGIVPGQEDIMKELLKLHLVLNPNMTPSSDWKMIAKNFDKIAELTNKLYTGCVEELKLVALGMPSERTSTAKFL